MNTHLRSLLVKIRNENSGNKELQILINRILNYEEGMSDLSVAKLLSVASEYDATDEEKFKNELRDFRIRFLSFDNFRTFPSNGKHPYGLSFTNSNNEVSSLFLVGRNGTGKSTLFYALEYLYTGKVSNIRISGGEKKNERENTILNLTYGFEIYKPENERNKPSISFILEGDNKLKRLYLNDPTKPIGSSVFFCSDFDVEMVERAEQKHIGSGEVDCKGGISGKNFFDYVIEQLGYDEIILLQNSIENNLKRYYDLKSIKYNGGQMLTADNVNEVIDAFIELMVCQDKNIDVEKHINKYIEAESTEAFLNMHLSDLENPDFVGVSFFSKQWEKVDGLSTLIKQKNENKDIMRVFTDESYNDNAEVVKLLEDGCWKLRKMYGYLLSYYSGFFHQEGNTENRKKIIEDLFSLRSEIKNDAEFINLFENKLNEEKSFAFVLDELRKRINTWKENFINEFKNDFAPFITRVLDMFSPKNEKFHIVPDNDRFTIIIEVYDGNKLLFETFPEKYLNAFRYKLYVISLKIAISFYYMQHNNCLIPIVIDDVFNASDFEHKVSMEQFVNSVFETYRTVLNFKQSLQIILLTHDEVVLDAFRNGVKINSYMMAQDKKEDEEESIAVNFLSGRMFPYSEAEKIYKLTKSNNDYYQLYLNV